MASAHLVVSSSLHRGSFGNGVLEERRRRPVCRGLVSLAGRGHGGDRKEVTGTKPGSGFREVSRRARSKVSEAPAAETGRICSTLEIPVTCYQILGVSEKAEKDEIVKAAMELKNMGIEDGYTAEVSVSRQDLLMDVRDKLLFEPEYAGNIKENVPPRSSLCIPWTWLPGALCILQEVGEEKLVLEIGRAALKLPDSKPYVHDLLLSMALAECSIAKSGFEKSKVSEGFEALARAQYLLRSKISLEKMPLLAQIEESLEELAPACTLELLSMPHIPDNAERRRGAIAALRELLRQGLDVESSCRVQDWPCFLNQAMNKLMAAEIIDLLSWDALANIRKNKKSLESQNQRGIVDFNCFYTVVLAHISYGFSTRQTEMISKAKSIIECLIASDGMDLKFEESFCLFLLGQEDGAVVLEKFRQLEVNGNSNSQISGLVKRKEEKDKESIHRTLEIWLKDAVLSVFPDTRDCSPSLANYFGAPKRIFSGTKQKLASAKPFPSSSSQLPSYSLLRHNKAPREQASNFSRQLPEAVKQLTPSNLEIPSALDKSSGNGSPAQQLKRKPSFPHSKAWKSWFETGDIAGKLTYSAVMGCILLGTFKLVSMQLGHTKVAYKWPTTHPKREAEAFASTVTWPSSSKNTPFISRNFWNPLGKLLMVLRLGDKHCPSNVGPLQNIWSTEKSSPSASATGIMLHKRSMDLEEAEALVKQWQDLKAEALGPNHQVETLSGVLDESMLFKWQELANSAKAQNSFWKFVLLQLSILRAEILSDGGDCEMAEIEAVIEEAAELVEESQPKHPSYYSSYRVQYTLKRQVDSSWRFCGGVIQD
ncbi:plastid division protein CDP1, chloroplastic [Ananas comosus]|uniref:Plastid division protein CDP1, chloroplastic n=1 Tax=Ananas comosus TaxID=4615 RepID=A0A6P5E9J4_ANACO|nr:plastid division protein CDP1, chloroplastic [Ananas comosus]